MAAHLLAGKGFKKVYNVKGGIQAWKGEIAEGPVELNMEMVHGDESPTEIVRLAYGMEEALGLFYTTMIGQTEDADVVALLTRLAEIEEKHKEYLASLYSTITGAADALETVAPHISDPVMEGGFNVSEFMEKNGRFMRTVSGVLDIAMTLETQALDLYLRFAQKVETDEAREILHKIGNEEKAHLASLGRLRELHP